MLPPVTSRNAPCFTSDDAPRLWQIWGLWRAAGGFFRGTDRAPVATGVVSRCGRVVGPIRSGFWQGRFG